jgi:hypothetical protein
MNDINRTVLFQRGEERKVSVILNTEDTSMGVYAVIIGVHYSNPIQETETADLADGRSEVSFVLAEEVTSRFPPRGFNIQIYNAGNMRLLETLSLESPYPKQDILMPPGE